MTSCKEIHPLEEKKRTKFQVEIDVRYCTREKIVKDLKKCGWLFTSELADIIEKG